MESILKLDENLRGKDWFVGDIHGCFSILEKLLHARHFDPLTDRLICTGDLIDRGPESERAVEFLEKRWFYSVRGNHDNFVLGDLNNLFHIGSWYSNGGAWWWTLKSEEQKKQFVEAFSKLPYAIEIETAYGSIGVVHAELPAGLSWNELELRLNEKVITESLLWSRRRLMNSLPETVEHIALVVSGHTMLHKPVRLGNCVFIDTGACVNAKFVLMDVAQLFDPMLEFNSVDIIYNRFG